MIFIYFRLLFFFGGILQKYEIKIIDRQTGKGIPFTSFIGIQDQKGGYADENGIINLNNNLKQAYIISCVGYKNDTLFLDKNEIALSPISIDLPVVIVKGKKQKLISREVGQFKKRSLSSFATTYKNEFYTFIRNPDTTLNWKISKLKIGVHGYRKSGFLYFKIRPIIKDTKGKIPNIDLLNENLTFDVFLGQNSSIIEFVNPIYLPKNGCFVGFEAVGYSIESGKFIPYTDYNTQSKNDAVLVNIPLVKGNTNTVFRIKNGKYWFGDKNEKYNCFAFGLDLTTY